MSEQLFVEEVVEGVIELAPRAGQAGFAGRDRQRW